MQALFSQNAAVKVINPFYFHPKSTFPHSFTVPLRALYLGDNEFENFPPEVQHLKNLQVVSTSNVFFHSVIS